MHALIKSHKIFSWNPYFYIHHAYFLYTLSNDIEKPDGTCSPTFAAADFSGLIYIHQSFLLKIQDLHK